MSRVYGTIFLEIHDILSGNHIYISVFPRRKLTPPLQVLKYILMVLNYMDKIEILKVMVQELLSVAKTLLPTHTGITNGIEYMSKILVQATQMVPC